jgi:hypothetical protein
MGKGDGVMAVYALIRPRVIRNALVKRLRVFPSVGESLVSPGAKVDAGSILGKYASRQRLRFVRMETSGERITATVLVAEGQKVKRGEVLGYYSYLFGLGYTEYTSPCDGEVVAISQATGRVSIKEEPSALASHLPGTVEHVDEAIGVWVRSRGDIVPGAAGAGFARSGTLIRKVESPDQPVSPQKIGPEDADLVLLAGSTVSKELLEACLRYRVAGIIAGSAASSVMKWYESLAQDLDWDEFLARYWARELRKKDAVVPRPTEIVPALVLTEGYGNMPMSGEAFELLSSCEGERVFVDGASLVGAALGRWDAGPCAIIPFAGAVEGEVMDDGVGGGAGRAAGAAAGAGAAVGDAAVGGAAGIGAVVGGADGASAVVGGFGHPAGRPAALRELAPGVRVCVCGLTQDPVEGTVEGLAQEDSALPVGIPVTSVRVVTLSGEHLTVPASNIRFLE